MCCWAVFCSASQKTEELLGQNKRFKNLIMGSGTLWQNNLPCNQWNICGLVKPAGRGTDVTLPSVLVTGASEVWELNVLFALTANVRQQHSECFLKPPKTCHFPEGLQKSMKSGSHFDSGLLRLLHNGVRREPWIRPSFVVDLLSGRISCGWLDVVFVLSLFSNFRSIKILILQL